jgi:acyl carrier protein
MNELVERLTKLGADQFRQVAARVGKAMGAPAEDGIRRRADAGAPAPLSFEQARTWFLDQLDPQNATFNLSLAAKASFARGLDLPMLERSVDAVVRRHEVLRSAIDWVDGRLVSTVVPPMSMRVPLVDLRHLAAEEREPEALRLAAEEARRPFDTRKPPLIRLLVVQMGETEYLLVLTTHHIASDGRSQGLLIREIATFYLSAMTRMPALLREPPIQYADFAAWQRRRMEGAEAERLLAYWTDHLRAPLPILGLRTDHPRAAVASFRAGVVTGFLAADAAAAIKGVAREGGATLFMVLLSALEALLYRYTGQTDLVVGSAVANRARAGLEKLVGMFINIIALRTDVSGNPSFRELLARVRATCEGAYAHQELPFAKVIDALALPRDPRRHPLFQVLFLLQNAGAGVEIPGLAGIQPLRRDNGGVKRDMSVYAQEESDGRIKLTIKYRADLWERPAMERMLADYAAVIEQVAGDPTLPLDALRVEGDRRGEDPADPLPPPARAIALHDETEARIAAVWCELLGRSAVDPSNDFFALGADSFLAARMLHRVGAELGIELPLSLLFEAPALADLASAARRRKGIHV